METDKWGRRIRAFRKLKGYTQEELARNLKISVSILGEIERGSRLPTESFLKEVATLLEIKVDELTPPEDLNE
ncbi:helix-turn-helix transcriptional regulator [Bacillus sp. FJAT-49736]|uniref:helix-turn-helix domain-containing protein n=1 Tax=Bacillus sp. FJAT-49736 TaxID=2833582 RepID=UPI001BCA2157|nr:helix-turn-helix transcriptional regulator [Bacillus sp. FJAT-49736]MBS4175746.1 helix-turn-helix transcriptional regulator [Bacillus sp. FJAT-49736]